MYALWVMVLFNVLAFALRGHRRLAVFRVQYLVPGCEGFTRSENKFILHFLFNLGASGQSQLDTF